MILQRYTQSRWQEWHSETVPPFMAHGIRSIGIVTVNSYATDLPLALWMTRELLEAITYPWCFFTHSSKNYHFIGMSKPCTTGRTTLAGYIAEQEYIPVGCVSSAAMAVLEGGRGTGGVSARGVSAQEGVCPGGCLSGVYTSPPDRMTDVCENITFPQLLLRTVINKHFFFMLGNEHDKYLFCINMMRSWK